MTDLIFILENQVFVSLNILNLEIIQIQKEILHRFCVLFLYI